MLSLVPNIDDGSKKEAAVEALMVGSYFGSGE